MHVNQACFLNWTTNFSICQSWFKVLTFQFSIFISLFVFTKLSLKLDRETLHTSCPFKDCTELKAKLPCVIFIRLPWLGQLSPSPVPSNEIEWEFHCKTGCGGRGRHASLGIDSYHRLNDNHNKPSINSGLVVHGSSWMHYQPNKKSSRFSFKCIGNRLN